MNPAGRDALIEAHLWLPRAVVSAMTQGLPRHFNFDDTKGAAQLGLVEAAIRYDDTVGVPFGLFAKTRIRGAVLDYWRADRWASRRDWELGRFVPVVIALRVAPADNDEYGHLDLIGGDEFEESVVNLLTLPSLLDLLTDRQRDVVESTFYAGERLAHIGRRLGVSESRICQIRNEACQIMREAA